MDNLAPLGPAPEEVIHVDSETTKSVIQNHARTNGYSIAITSYKPARVIYRCSKGGKYRDRKDSNMHESKRRKNTSTAKTGCPFRVDAAPCEAQPGWKVEVVENRHIHGPVAALSALPVHTLLIHNFR
jgi:Transcription factor AFT